MDDRSRHPAINDALGNVRRELETAKYGLALAIATAVAILGIAILLWRSNTLAFRITIAASGTLQPHAWANARSSTPGRIAQVLVETGTSVEAGQTVARLDTLALAADVQQAHTQLRLARLELLNATSQIPLERARLQSQLVKIEAAQLRARATLRDDLVQFRFGTNVDSVLRFYSAGRHVVLDAAVADILSLKADQTSLELALTTLNDRSLVIDQLRETVAQRTELLSVAEQRRLRADIIAPMAGIISTRDVTKLVGAGVSEGATVLAIADSRKWNAVVDVGERDVHRIVRGDKALIEIPAIAPSGNVVVQGSVESVAQTTSVSGDFEPASRSVGKYQVTISLDVDKALHPSLRHGFTVRARIVPSMNNAGQSRRSFTLWNGWF